MTSLPARSAVICSCTDVCRNKKDTSVSGREERQGSDVLLYREFDFPDREGQKDLD